MEEFAISIKNLKGRRNEQKKEIKNYFDNFHDNLDHYLNMNKKNIDIKKDIRNLEDKKYIKELDHDLEKQKKYTIDYFYRLQHSLDRCFYQSTTIKAWIKKWMEKYIKDDIYIKNMNQFLNNYCKNFIYFHMI